MSEGVCVLLDDTQVDLTGAERAWFFRRADLVVTGAGAERAAHFEAVFDPTCERLEIHYVRVLRGDKTFDHAGSRYFDVIRRERDLEQYKFDGRRSAFLSIPDVRAGDIVETAFTLYGMRPIFSGRHACIIYFDTHVGVLEMRHRLRAPETRTIKTRAVRHPPEEVRLASDGVVDRRWRAVERPRVRFENGAPPWIRQTSEIQFSEWSDWADVAAAFSPVYEEQGPLSDELEAEIARIASAFDDKAERAVAALRFVQDSIRYHAISMGDGGFVPRPVAEIWSTRFGDCKDKTKLYLSMAKRLGLEACAALVNTFEGEALGDWLPTALAFDHCVVRLRIDGRTHWLDPTRPPQPSRLDRIVQPRFGKALPLHEGVRELEDMGAEPFVDALHSEERIEFGDNPEAPVRYQWRTTQRGWRAELVRARIARDGERGLFRSMSDNVARVWPRARLTRDPLVEDNGGENVLTILEDYRVEEAWAPLGKDRVSFSTLDMTLRGQLPKLDPGTRLFPIDLGHVGRLSRRIEIHTHAPWRIQPFERRVDATTITWESALRQLTPSSFELVQKLEVLDWTLPAGEARFYHDIIAELEASDLRLDCKLEAGRFPARGPGMAAHAWLVTQVIVLAAAAAAWALFAMTR